MRKALLTLLSSWLAFEGTVSLISHRSASLLKKIDRAPLFSMSAVGSFNRTERGQKLRTLNWLKQVRNELTTAEFAIQIEQANSEGAKFWRKKRSIDYESIVLKLENSLQFIEKGGLISSGMDKSVNETEIEELQRRLQKTVSGVISVISTQKTEEIKNPSSPPTTTTTVIVEEPKDDLKEINKEFEIIKEKPKDLKLEKEKGTKGSEFGLFVRDDGTIDLDGAIQSGQEVARLGKELWERINGRDPTEGEESHQLFGQTKNKKADPPSLQAMIDRENELLREISALNEEAEELKMRSREVEKDVDSSVVRELMLSSRLKAEAAKQTECRLELHRLDMDMEKICYSIEQDISSSASSPREHRLLVAEFSMLDAQLRSLSQVLDLTVAEGIINPGEDGLSELELIRREVSDLKTRLGMDLESPTLSLPDFEKMIRYLREAIDKLRIGIEFFFTGIKLLGQDIQYAASLLSRAARGYTLKPREVRTLRRSGKDILTLVPATVILILPLTPLGHVLIFSFIQRYFPDFFPSTFTERRQNLLKLYQEVEKVEQIGEERSSSEDALQMLRKKFVGTLYREGKQ